MDRFLKASGRALLVAVMVLAATLPACRIGLAAEAGGASPAQEANTFTLDGKITQLESGKFTVNSEENILFHVSYNDQTAFKRSDGSAGSAKDLKVGARVHVVGDLKESGEIVALKIQMESADKNP